MPGRTVLVKITQVTDDDTGMYYIGELDGLFQQHELTEYLKSHGEKGKLDLHEHVAYLQSQIIKAWREINSEKENQEFSEESKSI